MKEISLFPLFAHGGWTRFDPVCFFMPKDGLFRSPEGFIDYPKEKNEDIRIICIGDSTTYGFAVTYDKSWPYILEELLNNEFQNIDIKVLNAGIPGASSRQVKRIFQFYTAKYNPDIVIWRKEFSLTDTYKVEKKSNLIRYWLWFCMYNSRIFRVATIAVNKHEGPIRTSERIYNFIMCKSEYCFKEGDENFKSNFGIVKKIAAENEIKYVLAVDYVQKDNDRIYNNDFTYKDKEIFPVVYTINAFKRVLEEKSINDLFIDDSHLTEFGTSIIAKEVFNFLTTQGWVTDIQAQFSR
ncbi:MAG: hypothetical protein P9M06_06655 [Candidatus Saelkia tenebricola]|nr:hypothetical protein [Candidatus Saelkia tenebricola]